MYGVYTLFESFRSPLPWYPFASSYKTLRVFRSRNSDLEYQEQYGRSSGHRPQRPLNSSPQRPIACKSLSPKTLTCMSANHIHSAKQLLKGLIGVKFLLYFRNEPPPAWPSPIEREMASITGVRGNYLTSTLVLLGLLWHIQLPARSPILGNPAVGPATSPSRWAGTV